MMYPTTNHHPFSGIMWKCLFHMTNVHGNDWRANLWLTGLRNNCARTTMSSSKYVNTKMCNKVLIENITIQWFLFFPIYYLYTPSTPLATPLICLCYFPVTVSGGTSLLFFSLLSFPQCGSWAGNYQLVRKTPGQVPKREEKEQEIEKLFE